MRHPAAHTLRTLAATTGPVSAFLALTLGGSPGYAIGLVTAAWHLRPRDVALLIVTFLVGSLAGPAVALGATVALAALLLIKRTLERSGHLPDLADGGLAPGPGAAPDAAPIPEGVEVFHVSSVLFLRRGGPIGRALSLPGWGPRLLILAVHDPSPIDPGALEGILALRDECRRRRVRLIVSGVHMGVRARGAASGIEWAADLDDALERARASGTGPGGD